MSSPVVKGFLSVTQSGTEIPRRTAAKASRASMPPAKRSEAMRTRFSKSGAPPAVTAGCSGMPWAICMGLVAVDHQRVEGEPDDREEDRHRGEERDGACGVERFGPVLVPHVASPDELRGSQEASGLAEVLMPCASRPG